MKNEISIVKMMLKTIFQSMGALIKAVLKIIYLVEKHKNNLIADLFCKLPRVAKVIIIYTLVILSGLSVFNLSSKVQTIVNNKQENTYIQIINEREEAEEEKEIKTSTRKATKRTTKKVTNYTFSNSIAESIYNKAISNGLTKNQAIIVVSISAHETGHWKSNVFINKHNFGGVMGKNGLKTYNTQQEGLNDYVNLLTYNYFNKGLNTIEKIGAKYCPVGAKNDPTNLNKNWVPGVTRIYNSYVNQ